MSAKSPGELTTVKELRQLYGCAFDATSRVMQILAQKGILKSEQGAHGGYQITKDLSRVSVHDLMEMIMGPMALARCLHEEAAGTCEMRTTCNIVSPMQTLHRKLTEFYRSLSLAEVLETKTNKGIVRSEQVKLGLQVSREREF